MRMYHSMRRVAFGLGMGAMILAVGGCWNKDEPKLAKAVPRPVVSEKPKAAEAPTRAADKAEAPAPAPTPAPASTTAAEQLQMAKPAESVEVPPAEPKPKSVEEIKQLAEQGNADAQFRLGEMARGGKGSPQDVTTAIKWYTKSAEEGNGDSQCALGEMYRSGQGVSKDPVKAYFWFNVSATLGFDHGIELRDAFKAELRPEQIAEAERMSKEWFDKGKNR